MNIVFIGAGGLATNLATTLFNKSYTISQVYSRTIESATSLANKINAVATNDISLISTDADLYIFAVKDSALIELLPQIPKNNGLWIHTAGSLPLNIFEGYVSNYGVLYPLQTFSKDRLVDFSKTPIFIEASRDSDLMTLNTICYSISSQVYKLSSEKRQYLHLTGVFACNFVNQMYAISESILKQEGIPFESVLPLIDETAAKVHSMNPQKAQTGPAIRFDTNIINKHLSLIQDSKLKAIYQLISEYIHDTNKENQ